MGADQNLLSPRRSRREQHPVTGPEQARRFALPDRRFDSSHVPQRFFEIAQTRAYQGEPGERIERLRRRLELSMDFHCVLVRLRRVRQLTEGQLSVAPDDRYPCFEITVGYLAGDL